VTLDDPAGTPSFELTAGRRVMGRSIVDSGTWGDLLRVEIDYNVVDPTDAQLFNLTLHELTAASGRLAVRTTETFRNISLAPGHLRNAAEVVNAESKLVQLTVLDDTTRPAVTGTQSVAAAMPADGDDLEVEINGEGPTVVALDFLGTTPATLTELRPFLEAAIRSVDPNDPRLTGATVQIVTIGANEHVRVLLGRGGDGFDSADVIHLRDVAGTTLGFQDANTQENAQMFALAGGGDGIAVTEAVLSGSQAAKTGIYALEDADIFNLMSLPEAVDLGATDLALLYTKALTYCRDRRAFLLVDIPEGVRTVDAMQTWMASNAGLRSDFAAVFFPRTRVPDPLEENRLKSRPASGTLAGLFARIDGDRGVWKAPAGTEARLRNVPELDYLLTDGENGLLNPEGINCLRNFPIMGNINWGARTLDGADVIASQWKYIPVRRLALYIEESLYRGLQWTVFEPNDEPLWAQIRLNVGAFMHDLFRKGAFQGSSPRQAYLVQCDAETTPQSDIDKGIVNIIVGFAPLKPAEFVILKIKQLAGQTPA